MSLRVLTIELYPFDFRVLVVIGKQGECVRYINRRTGAGFKEEQRHGACFHADGWGPFIWLPRKPVTPREIGTLAHEATHAAQWLMEWLGDSVHVENGEWFNHTVGHIVTRVLERS